MRALSLLITSLSSLGVLKSNQSRAERSRPVLDDLLIPIINIRQEPALAKTPEFVRRGSQASALVGSWLYIDGGQFSYKTGGKIDFQYSSTLLSIDMSRNWTNATVPINSISKPTGVPSLNAPSLCYYNRDGVIYSGFAGTNSLFGNAPLLPPQSIWLFKPDGSGAGDWDEVLNSTATVWSSIVRPFDGLQAEGSDRAWYLGGYASSQVHELNSAPIYGMTEFDMASHAITKGPSPGDSQNFTIAKGAMQHVPLFGPEGLLVVMGGYRESFSSRQLLDFGTVFIYDPAKQQWFNQETTGTAPAPREEFCSAGLNSTNGTYEIFVYGGYSGGPGDNPADCDTVNILTLPAFHWIVVPYVPLQNRHTHSCNAVGGSQIIIIGGTQPTLDHLTSLSQEQSEYNDTDVLPQGLAIFDMTKLQFVDQFTAGQPPYEQSRPIKDFYTRSQGGYQQNLVAGVAALMQINSSLAVPHPTSSIGAPSSTPPSSSLSSASPNSPPSPHTSARAIAAATIGVLVSAAILAFTFLFFMKRRKARPSLQITNFSGPPYEKDGTPFSELQYRERTLELNGDRGLIQELGERAVMEIGHRDLRAELLASLPVVHEL